MEQDCPDRNLLEGLLLGKLDAEHYESVVSHVDQCDRCQQRVLKSNEPLDKFSQALRETPELDNFETERECTDVIARLHEAAAEPNFFTDQRENVQRAALPGAIGPYEFLDAIGSGGMGTVYRARHTRLKRDVAIKVLREDRISAQLIARFEREIEAIGKVDHPNIVRATEADKRDGTHFLVMELIDGANLQQVAMLNAPLRYQDACELVRQAAIGLQHIHEQGFVHRDIKPSNLLLTRSGTVKIADLGLAMLRDEKAAEPLTALGAVMGTPDYLAPEQWRDTRSVDIRADIYSLGCTLYDLLVGRAPFQDAAHTSAASKMQAHLQESPPAIARDLPAELSQVLAACLAKAAANRPATPAELARTLEPFAVGANLTRLLLDAKGETQSMLAETRDLSQQATKPDHQISTRAISRRWMLEPLVVAGVLLLLLAVWQPWRDSTAPSNGTPSVQLQLEHYRYDTEMKIQERIGFIDEQHKPVLVGDEIRVVVSCAEPVWLLLVVLNPDGTVQTTTSDRQTKSLVFPSRSDEYFSLSDGVGQQAFVALTLDQPIADWAELQRSLPDLVWKPAKDAGVWRFDGQSVAQVFPEDEQPRGEIVRRGTKQFQEICERLAKHPHVRNVQGLAFSVRDRSAVSE